MLKIVTKPGCPWCDRVKELLTMHGLPYQERVMSTPTDQQRFAETYGVSTFPQVFRAQWEDEYQGRIGGYEDTQAWIAKGGHLHD